MLVHELSEVSRPQALSSLVLTVRVVPGWVYAFPGDTSDPHEGKNETIAFSMSFPEDALACPVTHSETTHGPVVECMLRGHLSDLLKGSSPTNGVTGSAVLKLNFKICSSFPDCLMEM